MKKQHVEDIKTEVRKRYGTIAKKGKSGCGCSSSPCCDSGPQNSGKTSLGYTAADVAETPEGSNLGLGCGNPIALAKLKPGETVLDLGSGGGFDCFLAAKEVGKSGFVIGVDMTAEMISKARRAAEEGDYKNVEFRLGEIEHLPVADSSVDVIVSNCVINLSPEKGKVFREAFRVLRPGGRLAISDIVATHPLPEKIKKNLVLLASCVAGAATISQVSELLSEAGFRQISIRPKGEDQQLMRELARSLGIKGVLVSADIEAVKPMK